MDNIFKKGDKYIFFPENKKKPEIGTVKNIGLSQVSDYKGFCYEVINLFTDNSGVLSIGQTRGSIHKLNKLMTVGELKAFKKGVWVDPTPTRYE